MKILHVTKKYPHALGGDATVVTNLQKQQESAGHKVVIVTSNCDEILNGAHIYKVGLKDIPSNLDSITLTRILSLIVLFFRMFAILKEERPDVIHAHSIDMTFFTSFAARFFGVPIVHTFHIVTFYDAAQPAIRRKTETWLAKRARLRATTAPNNYDVTKLRAAGLRQAVLLSNGVELAFWNMHTPAKKNGAFVFLTIGRLEQQKGYEYLIKAAHLLASAQAAAFRVVIAGEGSQKEVLQALVHTLRVDAIVSFVGSKNQEEIRALFAQADAAVVPSLYETTPITLLEAWSAAMPVIITSVGIMRDAPAGFAAAYIVPPKDERSLMAAMNQCMAQAPAREVVAAKGYEEVQKYDWPLIAKDAEAIYRGVL